MKKFTLLLVFALTANVFLTSNLFGQIAQRGTATSATSTNTNLTINKPTGVVSGDVMIVNITSNNGGTPSLSGWNSLGTGIFNGSNLRATVLYKVAGGSEPSSYTFALGAGANDAIGTIIAFSGVDNASPIDATGTMGLSASAGATATAPGITTNSANAAVIMFANQSDNRAYSNWTTTSPGNLTEIAQFEWTNGTQDMSVGAAWATKTTAGGTGDGTVTLEDNNDRWAALLVALKAYVAPPSVVINPPALSTTTILLGGTVNLTATRSANATWPGGNGNFAFDWSFTGPVGGSVSFTNDPVTITGTSSSTVASGFGVAGDYFITCTVTEQGGGQTVASLTKKVTVLAAAPTVASLWATSNNGNDVSSFVVANGTYFSGPTFLFDPFPSTTETTAALGRNDQPSAALGHYYWLPNTGTNGVVNVYAANSTGGSRTLIGTFDVNGAGNNNSLGFVRLGMGPDGTGWILAGDGTTLYLSKFTSNGVNPVTITNEDASVSLVGGSVGTFQNGDVCISGNGVIYALANDGSGVTQIFRGSPTGSTTTLTKVFDLVDENGAPFTGSVNGVAFDLAGSLYISTSTGLYYIDAATVNGAAGTVGCFLVWSGSGLQDLASNIFPTQSTLPVTLGTFSVAKQGDFAVLNWKTTTEINTDHFDIERSYDGVSFTKVAAKAAAGNSSSDINYQHSDPINYNYPIVYYRLKTVDIDAKSSYSKIVALRLSNGPIKNLTVFPNPFTTDLKLQISSLSETTGTVRISNAIGQVVYNRNIILQKGENIVVLNSGLETLKPGMHLMEVITTEGKVTQKIIKR
jgi:hypothetical protein